MGFVCVGVGPRYSSMTAACLLFFYDQIDTTQTCVRFRADRWYPVANMTIQHRMRVYDYYEPGKLQFHNILGIKKMQMRGRSWGEGRFNDSFEIIHDHFIVVRLFR